MGALAAAIAPIELPPAPSSGANAYWDKRCKADKFTRWPKGLRTTLFRATDGHATAIAVCDEIVELTHGAKVGTGYKRPLRTPPLSTEYFAEKLGVTTRAIQDAFNFLLERQLIDREPAANRAFTYQARPWVWEALADAAAGKATEAAPSPDDSNDPAESQESPVRITKEPLVMLPGKRSRPLPLSESIRSALTRVTCENDTGFQFRFDPILEGGNNLLIRLMLPEAEKANGKANEKRSSPQFTSLAASQVIENIVPSKNGTAENGHHSQNGHFQQPPPQTANGRRTPAKQTSPSARLTTLREGIDSRFARLLAVGIDDTKLNEVAKSLGVGDPSVFFEIIDVPRQRKRVAKEGYGLLPWLAADAATETARRAAEAQASQPTAAPAPPSFAGEPEISGSLWAAVRKAIRATITDANYENWFRLTRLSRIEGDEMRVLVPSKDVAGFLNEEYAASASSLARRLKPAEGHLRIQRVVFEAETR